MPSCATQAQSQWLWKCMNRAREALGAQTVPEAHAQYMCNMGMCFSSFVHICIQIRPTVKYGKQPHEWRDWDGEERTKVPRRSEGSGNRRVDRSSACQQSTAAQHNAAPRPAPPLPDSG